jgi:hypothetical protein
MDNRDRTGDLYNAIVEFYGRYGSLFEVDPERATAGAAS